MTTPTLNDAVHTALRIIAAHDLDRAREVNGVGFSKSDTGIGNRLAAKRTLDADDTLAGTALAIRYKRQLPADLVKFIVSNGTEDAPEPVEVHEHFRKLDKEHDDYAKLDVILSRDCDCQPTGEGFHTCAVHADEDCMEGGIDMPAADPAPAFTITLTDGQEKARQEILESMGKVHMLKGREHCLRGFAGTGKTTAMQVLVRDMQERGKRVAVCAPTNKAVAVLERKMREAGIDVETRTIYSLLGLTPGSDDAKRKPKRVGKNHSAKFDVIIIDECSMVGIDLMDWIKQDLREKFTLYIGDPAQLPPVGETLSQTFQVEDVSTLDQIMRQAADNPIIGLSIRIRQMIEQGRPDWSAFADADTGSDVGIFRPDPDTVMSWIESAFLSEDFDADPDSFRYLCWTNARVAYINDHIRRLKYGDTSPYPFMPGERVIVRSSIQDETKSVTLINTNDEADIVTITPGTYAHKFDAHSSTKFQTGRLTDELPAWTAELKVWNVQLRNRAGQLVDCRIAQDQAELKAINDQLTAEARANHFRWREFFDFQDSIARLQAPFAMTVHTSQGSTFGSVFVDIADCSRNSKVVESLQLLYVACTRPQRALVLV